MHKCKCGGLLEAVRIVNNTLVVQCNKCNAVITVAL